MFYAFDYLFGLGIFGLIYWLLNGIKVLTIANLSPFDADLMLFINIMWGAGVVIYLIFGAFWLPNKLREWEE